MSNEQTSVVEVNGTKYEVDLRGARKVDTFKVNDKVRLLVTRDYYGTKVHNGVIVGIEAFKSMPTIVVAYIEDPLATDPKIEFAYINAQSKGLEIAPMIADTILPTYETIVQLFMRAIDKKKSEIRELEVKRDYFLKQFGTTFGVAAKDILNGSAAESQAAVA